MCLEVWDTLHMVLQLAHRKVCLEPLESLRILVRQPQQNVCLERLESLPMPVCMAHLEVCLEVWDPMEAIKQIAHILWILKFDRRILVVWQNERDFVFDFFFTLSPEKEMTEKTIHANDIV